MAPEIKPYIPDLDKIAHHCKDPSPVIVTKEEFDEVMSNPDEYGLYRGTNMSDEEILRAMELGWIKIWNTNGKFNLLNRIQDGGVDFTLGPDFWHYRQHEISRLTIGEHVEPIRRLGLLEYTYKLAGEEFVFYPGTIVLALTNEGISLSNTLYGRFDGRSTAARLGLSNHQTAGYFGAGFSGRGVLEMSNVNTLHVGLRVNEGVGFMTFHMFGSPSTRPRTQKLDSGSFSQNQVSPFGSWDEKWTRIREETIGKAVVNAQQIEETLKIMAGADYRSPQEEYNRRHTLM